MSDAVATGLSLRDKPGGADSLWTQHMYRPALVVGTLGMVLLVSGSALDARRGQPTFTSTVELVTVGVTVTNLTHERVIDGLTAVDFELYEDGERQPLTVATHERRPVSLCIVLDASGSMEFALKRQLASVATEALLHQLHAGDEVAAVVFRDRTELRVPWTRIGDLTTVDWGDAPSGGTSLMDGLRAGLTQLGSARNARRAIVVLSDGFENTSATSLSMIATTRQQSEAVVYAIGLGDAHPSESGPPSIQLRNPRAHSTDLVQPAPPPAAAAPPNLLEQLVGDSGGTVRRVRTSSEAQQAVRNVLDDLQYEYTLGYTPSRAMDGRYRRLKVGVTRRGVFVRHRQGYLAMPGNPRPSVPMAATSASPATTAGMPVDEAAATAMPAVRSAVEPPSPVPPALAATTVPRNDGVPRPAYEAAVWSFRGTSSFAEAQRLLGAWTRDQLSTAVSVAARRDDRALAQAAALFHLEVALTGAPRSPDDALFHLTMGERVLGPLDERDSEFISRWYAASLSVFLAQTDTVRARVLADRGRKRVPGAARQQFWGARVEEIEALRYDPDLAKDDTSRIGIGHERRLRLALAERGYRQAVALDSAHAAAAVHLGRVLFLLDKDDEARRILEPLVGAADIRPADRYLASLFLAAAYERAGAIERARAVFEAIPAFAPGRQTSWVALAQLEQRAGRIDRARDIVKANVATAPDDARDEWWAYRNGALDVEDLSWLRADVHR